MVSTPCRPLPNSHKVIFENEFVRVLEVTLRRLGSYRTNASSPLAQLFSELGHRRRGSSHIRYHSGDGGGHAIFPAKEAPFHIRGTWSIHWMKPEPMHAIEVVETPKSAMPVPESRRSCA